MAKRDPITEIKRVNGYLKEFITYFDDSGRPISQVMNPLMVELKPRDILQIFIGAFLVASPLCFTEEVWSLSISLKEQNIYYLISLSFILVTSFIYFNFYRFRIKGHIVNFIKRVLATYLITASSVMLLLFLIDKLPLSEELFVSFKRVVIISFPSLFGAILSDYIK